AARVFSAGRQSYQANQLLRAEQARQLRMDGEAAQALALLDELQRNAAESGLDPMAIMGLERRRALAAHAAGNADIATLASNNGLSAFPADVGMLRVAADSAAGRRQFNLAVEYQQQLCQAEPTAANWLALAGYRTELNDNSALAAYNEALR